MNETIEEYEKFADCIIVCPLSGTEYPMIKQLLMIKSEYFRAIFSDSWKQSVNSNEGLPKLTSPISLSDKQGWSCVRHYLLIGTLTIRVENLISSLQICLALMIHSLFHLLQSRIAKDAPHFMSKFNSSDISSIFEMKLIPFHDLTTLWR